MASTFKSKLPIFVKAKKTAYFALFAVGCDFMNFFTIYKKNFQKIQIFKNLWLNSKPWKIVANFHKKQKRK